MNKAMWLSSCAAIMIQAVPALAQPGTADQFVGAGAGTAEVQSGSARIDEIMVTAQRRSERLQDVAIAVTAFSGDSLREQGYTSSMDIAKLTPGINVSGAVGGQGMQFSIRGVTQSDFNDAIEGPVAVYIDDVYINSQQGQGMALFDLARVEALKGPQGTLFGRNATGGLVHFVINKPELDEVSGYGNMSYGRFNQTILESAINLPLNDQMAIRASGTWNRHGSYWKNVYPAGMVANAPLNYGLEGPSSVGEDLGEDDKLAGRLQWLFAPSDDLQIRLTGSAMRQNLSTSPWTASAVVPVMDDQDRVVGELFASPTETRAAIGPDGQNYFNPAVLAFQGFLVSPNNDGQRSPGASWFGHVPQNIDDRLLSQEFALEDLNRFRAYNTALHVDYNFGDTQFTSVTSWSQYRKNFLLDGEASPVNAFDFGTRSNVRSISQEMRFAGISDRFKWTAGAYYLHIKAANAQGLLGPKGSALSLVFGMVDSGLDAMSVYELRTDSASVFGQVEWEFAPTLSLVLGSRLIREHQEYEFSSDAYLNENDYTIDTTTALFSLQPSFQDKRTNWLWAGKAQLEYRPTSDLLIYGGVNRGVKAGSYNAKLADGSPALSANDIPYKSEVLTSLEAGLKYSTPDNKYAFNLSAFHYIYDDYQSFTFTNISGLVQNRDARTNGVEVEVGLRPVDGLRLSLGGSYLDAKVKDVQIAPGVTQDAEPTYTPEFSGSFGANYMLPKDILGGTVEFGGLVTHQSSFYNNARNFDAQRVGDRTLVDVSAQWYDDEGLSVSLYLKNAFDARYKTVGLDLATACGCNVEAYGPPRTWGMNIGYSF